MTPLPGSRAVPAGGTHRGYAESKLPAATFVPACICGWKGEPTADLVAAMNTADNHATTEADHG